MSSNRFELDKSSHIIDIEVKSNIEYEIIIPSACQSWITQNNKSRSLEKKKYHSVLLLVMSMINVKEKLYFKVKIFRKLYTFTKQVEEY